MITLAQIDAESSATPITESERYVLENILKQSKVYSSYTYGNLGTLLDEEVATPTYKTKVLRAVVTAHGELPSLVVESQGSSDDRTYFNSRDNWDALAKDILTTFYANRIIEIGSGYSVVQRTICDLVLRHEENTVHPII